MKDLLKPVFKTLMKKNSKGPRECQRATSQCMSLTVNES